MFQKVPQVDGLLVTRETPLYRDGAAPTQERRNSDVWSHISVFDLRLVPLRRFQQLRRHCHIIGSDTPFSRAASEPHLTMPLQPV